MNLDQLTELFKWMVLINIALLILSALLIVTFRKMICSLHGKLFSIDEDKLPIIFYAYLGFYKIMIIVFNIVPYLSLLILNQ